MSFKVIYNDWIAPRVFSAALNFSRDAKIIRRIYARFTQFVIDLPAGFRWDYWRGWYSWEMLLFSFLFLKVSVSSKKVVNIGQLLSGLLWCFWADKAVCLMKQFLLLRLWLYVPNEAVLWCLDFPSEFKCWNITQLRMPRLNCRSKNLTVELWSHQFVASFLRFVDIAWKVEMNKLIFLL